MFRRTTLPASACQRRGGARWWGRDLCRAALLWCVGGLLTLAGAQNVGQFGGGGVPAGPPQRSVTEWLARLQQASRVPSYVGTFVVSSASGALSSSRIWHVCEGDVQLERVDTLTGTPRSTVRRNDTVMTFLPDARVVTLDQRQQGAVFPNLLSPAAGQPVADFYDVRELGRGRVAGCDADIVQLLPRDAWRFGYRIWSENRTGLVLKTQTLDAQGRVLEQAAFSELQLDAPVQAEQLRQMMASTQGYRLVQAEQARTTPQAEGWQLSAVVPGFEARNCYRRPLSRTASLVQCIFSDGLATVSLFMQPLEAAQHPREGAASMGATQALTRRVADRSGHWWITAVGEVPSATLQAFVQGLARIP